MDETFAAIDLETTGLSPESDRIIEIGAVRFRGAQVVDTYHAMVNPQRELSSRVRLLTGIRQEEVDSAPLFSDLADGLRRFLDGVAIVGQNVGFDFAFLQAEGFPMPRTLFDTFDLACVLFPQLSDYSLVSLAQHLGVPCDVHHRALEDAVTAKDVFLGMLDRVNELDQPLLAEINRLTLGTDWVWRPVFIEAEGRKAGTASLWDRDTWHAEIVEQAGETPDNAPPVAQAAKPADVKTLSEMLGRGGVLSRSFPGFEYRPGQVAMMEQVALALDEGHHLMVEAGTGIGKSLAYLLPAAFFAVQKDLPVVISTNTINLQEQITEKDIPDLLRALESSGEPRLPLEVAELKGRTNYLCRRRWNTWLSTPGLPWEETKFLLRLLVWLQSTHSGDRTDLNLLGTEPNLWHRLCASEENCVTGHCPYYPGGCFLYRARQAAQRAHLVIVNHALLLSDLVGGGGILPEYRHLVVDEAHHLEAEATEQLGYVVTEKDVHECLAGVGKSGGLASHLRSYLRASSLAAAARKDVERRLDQLRQQAETARGAATEMFATLARLVAGHAGERVEYERNLRVTEHLRESRAWWHIEMLWEDFGGQLAGLDAGLAELSGSLDRLSNLRRPELDSSQAEIASMRQQIESLRHRLDCALSRPETDTVYWASLRGENDRALHAAPLRVGRLLDSYLFSKKDSVVLTSATLTIGGDFEYAKESLGVTGAEELVVDAPFDYMASTMVYLPEDMPPPDRAGYRDALQQSLIEVCRETRGRTLALFTSHSGLRDAYAVVQPVLEDEGIMVLGQGVDGSPRRVLNRFKASPEAVLMGTTSLWEGVDVVGRALSVLVIARLPFGVPTDPVLSARSELFEDPFNQYQVPMTVLKFRQGFGRLIRSRTDRGVVLILDNRVQTKAYGDIFLQSLPRSTVVRASLSEMPHQVAEWLAD